MVNAQSFTNELGQIRDHLLAVDHGVRLQLGRRLSQLGAKTFEFVVEPIRGDELKGDNVQCVENWLVQWPLMDQIANPDDVHVHVCEQHGLLRTEMPEKRGRIDVGLVGNLGHCHIVETSRGEQVQC